MKKYYYSLDGKSKNGPYHIHELIDHEIMEDTLIWHIDLDNWVKASSLPELENIIRQPHPQPPELPPIVERKPQIETSNEEVIESIDRDYEENPIGIPVSRELFKPKTYMTESVLTTIFCLPIFGIIAIVHASRVNSRYKKGDYDGAYSSSNSARTWMRVALIFGLVLHLIRFILILSFEI